MRSSRWFSEHAPFFPTCHGCGGFFAQRSGLETLSATVCSALFGAGADCEQSERAVLHSWQTEADETCLEQSAICRAFRGLGQTREIGYRQRIDYRERQSQAAVRRSGLVPSAGEGERNSDHPAILRTCSRANVHLPQVYTPISMRLTSLAAQEAS